MTFVFLKVCLTANMNHASHKKHTKVTHLVYYYLLCVCAFGRILQVWNRCHHVSSKSLLQWKKNIQLNSLPKEVESKISTTRKIHRKKPWSCLTNLFVLGPIGQFKFFWGVKLIELHKATSNFQGGNLLFGSGIRFDDLSLKKLQTQRLCDSSPAR